PIKLGEEVTVVPTGTTPGAQQVVVDTQNNGVDAQGNPFFYLKFKNTSGKKNYVVVGTVPEMRFYGTQPQLTDVARQDRLDSAIPGAKALGPSRFNSTRAAKFSYPATNMYQTETTFSVSTKNPYTGTTGGSTVLALNPHQYQPLTLGPDLTKVSKQEVVWN